MGTEGSGGDDIFKVFSPYFKQLPGHSNVVRAHMLSRQSDQGPGSEGTSDLGCPTPPEVKPVFCSPFSSQAVAWWRSLCGHPLLGPGHPSGRSVVRRCVASQDSPEMYKLVVITGCGKKHPSVWVTHFSRMHALSGGD